MVDFLACITPRKFLLDPVPPPSTPTLAKQLSRSTASSNDAESRSTLDFCLASVLPPPALRLVSSSLPVKSMSGISLNGPSSMPSCQPSSLLCRPPA